MPLPRIGYIKVYGLCLEVLSHCVLAGGDAHFGECSCHVMRQPCGENQGNTSESRSGGSEKP